MELPHDPHPVAIAFIDAARETGLPVVEDNNGADMEGASYFNLTIKNGRRNSVASAYLAPAIDRPNLTVISEAETRRLILDGTRCRGVEYAHDGRLQSAVADREVVLGVGTEIARPAPLGRDWGRQQEDTDVRDTRRFFLAEVQSTASDNSLTEHHVAN